MDETVINGANTIFPRQFGIPQEDDPQADRNQWLLGCVRTIKLAKCHVSLLVFVIVSIINGAPYLCCGVVSCWLTCMSENIVSIVALLMRPTHHPGAMLSAPLNKYLGRRGTIFLTAAISFITCIWQALTDSWWHLFIARFFLGFGIGPKSATVAIYAAECSPPPIRGALVMQWQSRS